MGLICIYTEREREGERVRENNREREIDNIDRHVGTERKTDRYIARK